MLRTGIVVLALATMGWAQNAAPADKHAVASGATKSTKPTPKLLSAARPSITEDSAAESELLSLANQSREDAGLPPLRINRHLMDAARAHAWLMIQQRQLSHQFDGEPNLLSRLHATGVPLNSVGENVAYNSNAEKAFHAFMNSPPHRSNLLDPDFNAAAFVAIWSDGQLYVVQDFVRQVADITPVSTRK